MKTTISTKIKLNALVLKYRIFSEFIDSGKILKKDTKEKSSFISYFALLKPKTLITICVIYSKRNRYRNRPFPSVNCLDIRVPLLNIVSSQAVTIIPRLRNLHFKVCFGNFLEIFGIQ